MRARTLCTLALVLSIAALAAWRAVCVGAGPDIDTDAYAHHVIARAILADPRDLAVHWVWLPLFHYAQVPLVWLGGTMQQVRWANVVLSGATPVVLFAHVRRTARPGDAGIPPEAVALLAACFAGACPIAMQMGTTAQPEPLFALLVLGVALALERRSHRAAAAMLGAAVMLRYEAWASLVAITGVLALDAWRRQRGGQPGRAGEAKEANEANAWIVVAVPVALILAWAALRRPVDGRWFGFLRQTHEFASGALHDAGPSARSLGPLALDILHYPVAIALRVLGPVAVLAPFGLARTVRQQGGRFVLVFAACLGFVSLTWVMRATLGLDRHIVAVVPLYAACAAQAIAAAADAAVRGARRILPDERAVVAGRGLAAGLALSSLSGLTILLAVWMGFWRASLERGWPERAALGQYLRSLSGSPRVYCDDATLEVLSGLDRQRFDRHWVDDPHTWDLVAGATRDGTDVYVATWRRKLRGHEGAGEIVFAAGSDPADRDGTGVAVMRVGTDGGRTRR